jgi:hypothetical protein
MSWRVRLLAHVLAIALLFGTAAMAHAADPGCHRIPVTSYSPTGIAGCLVYGEGTASMWGGPGAARNDCTYPWRACQPIAIQSLTTGLVIRVMPVTYCDCYTGTRRERIVDLDPSLVRALGLDPAEGLWPVRVWPIGGATNLSDVSRPLTLPDTAMGGGS